MRYATHTSWHADLDEPMAAEAEATGARIVVAEDDEDTRDLLVTMLTEEGYVVEELASGRELRDYLMASLVDAYTAPAADLVIADERMPGRTGLEAIDRLRMDGWSTPVILLTASGTPSINEEAERLSARVMKKPVSLEALAEAIDHLLAD